MKTATAAAALMLIASASAKELPLVSPDYAGYFETLDNALYYSLAQAMALSTQFEHGGIIVRYNGAYYASPPVNTGSDRSVDFAHRYYGELVAIYHTHLCIGPFQTRFSPADIKHAQANGVPSYLGVACTGELRMFDARTMRAVLHGREKGTADGTVLSVAFKQPEFQDPRAPEVSSASALRSSCKRGGLLSKRSTCAVPPSSPGTS